MEPTLIIWFLLVISEISCAGPSKLIATNQVGNETLSVCRSTLIRFDLEQLENLRGCRVVEGSVSILMLDELEEAHLKNYSFPELTEITGFLMFYRISGLKSLKDLFPNLAIIRGDELFQNYSLILYEMLDLEEIGLTNLQVIERGSVRIEKNDNLCFANKIDWSAIATFGENNFIAVRFIFTLSCRIDPIIEQSHL